MLLYCDFWFLGRQSPWGCSAAKGDDPLIECVNYLVSEFVRDILGKRVSPLLEEAAVAKHAPAQNT